MIVRPPYNEDGIRLAKCERCGMSWVEGRESVELIPGSGEWTTAGERSHECPEPFDRKVAEAWLSFHVSCGIPCHPRTAARIRLGLNGA